MFKEPASPFPRYVTAVELMSRRYDIRGLPVFGPADDSLSWVPEKRRGRNTQAGGPRKQGRCLRSRDAEQ